MWKVLQGCFREIGGAVFLVVVLAIAEVAWQIAIPWYMTNLIDLGLLAQNLSVVYPWQKIRYCCHHFDGIVVR